MGIRSTLDEKAIEVMQRDAQMLMTRRQRLAKCQKRIEVAGKRSME
jgi:hypothetical protein